MRYSKQRELVLQKVEQLCDHPTAEEIFDLAAKECPGLSLGTVYRNIRQLADNGEILTLETEDTRSHYDGNTTPHRHFVCGVCGRILDLFFAVEAPPELLDRGFLVESEKCIYYGTCPDCAKKR